MMSVLVWLNLASALVNGLCLGIAYVKHERGRAVLREFGTKGHALAPLFADYNALRAALRQTVLEASQDCPQCCKSWRIAVKALTGQEAP
jgi:hypothetical protein